MLIDPRNRYGGKCIYFRPFQWAEKEHTNCYIIIKGLNINPLLMLSAHVVGKKLM